MQLLKQAFKYITGMWFAQVRLTVCLFFGVILLMALVMGCDIRFLSKQEMLNIMTRCYGREFAALSSRSLAQDELAEGVLRARVYELAPVDEPERRFWAFNIVSAESGGLFGASNGVSDSYTADMMAETFDELATKAGLAYELTYRSYPGQPATGYYSAVRINIEFSDLAELPSICDMIAQTLADTLARLPEDFDYAIDAEFFLKYQPEDWPKDKFYQKWIDPFPYVRGDADRTRRAMSAADIEAEFMEGLNNYLEKDANRQ